MNTTLKLLVGALASLSLAACSTWHGAAQNWKPGNMKFTTGLSAPAPEPRR